MKLNQSWETERKVLVSCSINVPHVCACVPSVPLPQEKEKS